MIRQGLYSCYVRGLKPFRTLYDFKCYTITLSKGFKSVTSDSGEMAENILTTLLLKKTKPLAVVKPFYCSVYHVCTFS